MSETDEKWQALCYEALKLITAGKYFEAFNLVIDLQDLPDCTGTILEKVEVLVRVARSGLQANQLELAETSLMAAEAALNVRTRDDGIKAANFDELAVLWLKYGNKQKAADLWKKAATVAVTSLNDYCSLEATDVDSLKVLAVVVPSLVDNQQVADAQKYVNLVTSKHWRNKLQKLINNPSGKMRIYKLPKGAKNRPL